MQTFVTFKNFIGFGEFVSFDFRVEVRNLLTGRIVKRLEVNHKVAEYMLGFEAESHIFSDMVIERAHVLLNDLGKLCATNLGEYPDARLTLCRILMEVANHQDQIRAAGDGRESVRCLAALVRDMMKLNHSSFTE